MTKKLNALFCSLILTLSLVLIALPVMAYADEVQNDPAVQEVSDTAATDKGGNAKAAKQNQNIPDERLLPRLTDEAGLLEAEDAQELEADLDALSKELSFDVNIHTTENLGKKDVVAYADDFYDYNGFGYGENRDGILLVICMSTHDWYISTTGEGITAFTDAGIQYLGNEIINDLSSENYTKAFNTFVDYAEDYVLEERNGQPYDADHLPTKFFDPDSLIVGGITGAIVAFFMARRKKEDLTTVAPRDNAYDYVAENGVTVAYQNEHFVRTDIREIALTDDTEAGGSSTHVSSSGTTHGGGGGKF